MAEFIVLKTNLVQAESEKLVASSVLESNGFVANTAAYASDMNAILHEVTVFVVAFAKTMTGANAIAPTDSVNTIKTRLTNYLTNIAKTTKADAAVAADYVGHSLGYTVNGISLAYNGSDTINIPAIWAPTSKGTYNNQLLLSNGALNAAPTWSSSVLGSATTPLYLNTNGIITVCTTYAGGTAITLNDVPKGGSTASFYAPEAKATAEKQILMSSSSNLPVWSSATFGGEYIPTYLNSNGQLTVCALYAGGTRLNVNSSQYTTAATIWAPTSSTGNDSGKLLQSNGSSAPTWSSLMTTTHTTYTCLHSASTSGIYIGNAANNVGCKLTVSDKSTSSFTVYGGMMIGAQLANSTDKAINVNNNAAITKGGQITGTSFNATSDLRLKANVTPYASKISILDLPIVQFDFKSDGSHHIGCIAQDLQRIAPELVHEDSNGYLTIEESKIVYLLLAEVKKLREEIEMLKNK